MNTDITGQDYHNTERGDGLLVLLPSVCAVERGDGRIALTEKFVEGVSEFAWHWDGPIRVVIEPEQNLSDNLDNTWFERHDLPFDIRILSFLSSSLEAQLVDASVVLGGTSHRQNHVAGLCKSLGVPCIYTSEYTLKTRLQILHSDIKSRYQLLKSVIWECRQEYRQRKAIALAAGLQANGTPTYDAYRTVSPEPMLFFDTRTGTNTLVSETDLQKRLDHLALNEPLRLAFSGRLIRMKGVQWLPKIAAGLRAAGVSFRLSIYGDGVMFPVLQREIHDLDLEDHVFLRGVLPFERLMQTIRSEVDLFVCPHVQGDPSCTYLETFACGVPIVGADNEAWKGLQRRVDAGWTVPVGRPDAAVECIRNLDRNRNLIVERSFNARRFAVDHIFELTFKRRIEHMRAISRGTSRPS